jgi:LPS export ABC transporter protein LptC
MNFSFIKLKTLARLTIFGFIILMIWSCENKVDFIPKSDLLTLPSITDKDVVTVYTDSGKLKLILLSKLVEKHDNKELSYIEFRLGMKVVFYEGKKEPVGSVTAKYAKYTNKDNLWELRDSVVVINEKNDKLETELLFWNQATNMIYTDRFVKITNEEEIMQGFGFESDSRLTRRKMKKVNAIIYLKDE